MTHLLRVYNEGRLIDTYTNVTDTTVAEGVLKIVRLPDDKDERAIVIFPLHAFTRCDWSQVNE